MEQNTSEWLAARMAIPTASCFDKIITPAGKKSAQSRVYMAKLLWEYRSGYPLQEDEDPYESNWMANGKEYEARTIATFEFVTGYKAEKIGGVSNWEEMIWASPDRVILNGKDSILACIEAKSPAPWTQLLYWFDNEDAKLKVENGKDLELVANYKPQLQGQLLVPETDKQFICSDHPKLKPVLLEVGRDEKFIKTLSDYLREFVDTMLERRLVIDREFGKPKAISKESGGFGDLGLTEEDFQALMNS